MIDSRLTVPEALSARQAIMERSVGPGYIRLFFRSLGSPEEICFALTLLQDADDDYRAAAVSGAYYDAGLVGIGDRLAPLLADGNRSSASDAVNVLRSAVLDAHDITAFRALMRFSATDLAVRWDVEAAQADVRTNLDPAAFQALADSKDRTASPEFLIRSLSGTSRLSSARIIWMLKSFHHDNHVRDLLLDCVEKRKHAVTAAYILACFFGVSIDVDRLLFGSRIEDYDELDLINLICRQAIRTRNASLLEALGRIESRIMSPSAVAAVADSCRAIIAKSI